MDGILNIEKKQDINVISFLFNEINIEEREYIKEKLGSLIHAGEKQFVIDLSRVGFVSSLVIAVIVFFAKEVRKNEGRLKLSGLSSEARSIFQLTHLDKAFELYDTIPEALKSF